MGEVKSSLLSSLPGIHHGFGTIAHPVPESFQSIWNESHPSWKQVHGVALAEVLGPRQQCGEVDSLYTFQPSAPVAVVTADCVPVLLAERHGKGVAAAHAGWRGTRGHILRALWERLAARGERAEDWVAAVGPAIGPCCYEVSGELAADFGKEFAWAGNGVAVPRPRILDLPAINAAELRAIGFSEVEVIRNCTRCSVSGSQPVFHSYRREKASVRQWSVIMRASEAR